MGINFSFTVFSIHTFLLHAVAAGLIYYAVRDLDMMKQAAVIVALILWGTTVVVA